MSRAKNSLTRMIFRIKSKYVVPELTIVTPKPKIFVKYHKFYKITTIVMTTPKIVVFLTQCVVSKEKIFKYHKLYNKPQLL